MEGWIPGSSAGLPGRRKGHLPTHSATLSPKKVFQAWQHTARILYHFDPTIGLLLLALHECQHLHRVKVSLQEMLGSLPRRA